MTNDEKCQILKSCVEAVGIQNFCFCRGVHKQLCAPLEQAGVDPHIATRVGWARFSKGGRILGMRPCCLSAEKFLDIAAQILEAETKAQT